MKLLTRRYDAHQESALGRAQSRSAALWVRVRRILASTCRGTLRGVAHYLFNRIPGDAVDGSGPRKLVTECLGVMMWGIDAGEPHSHALGPGDLALIYLGEPERLLVGRAELASAVHEWTPSEAQMYPGDSPSGVLLAKVEAWDPPVPMQTVVLQMDRVGGARADFQAGVIRITPT